MNKEGLSSVIAVLLVVLLVLVSVFILWVFVRERLQQDSEKINLDAITVSLGVENVKLGSDVRVSVKRNAGEGDINGIRLVLSDGQNSELFERETALKELESQTFVLNPSGLNINSLEELIVVPVYNFDSGDFENAGQTFSYDMDNAEVEECTPVCGSFVCGDDGCGGSCGSCDELHFCSEGMCELNDLDIISWWKFDSDAFDSVGENHGLGNDVIIEENGMFNSAYFFDGDNSYVSVEDDSSFDIPTPVSISFWINPYELEEDQYIVYRKHWLEIRIKDEEVRVKWRNENSGNLKVEGGLSEGWVHVVSENTAKLYLNGIEEDQDSDNSYELRQSDKPLYFGIKEDEKAYEGLIDEVVLFNKALSEEEILLLYESNLNNT